MMPKRSGSSFRNLEGVLLRQELGPVRDDAEHLCQVDGSLTVATPQRDGGMSGRVHRRIGCSRTDGPQVVVESVTDHAPVHVQVFDLLGTDAT
jgi:hypothetical protein